MAAYVGLKPHMDVVTHHTTIAGDFAMTRSQWRIEGTDENGKPIEVHHHGMEVHRRLPDGTGVFFIDHPFGADPSWARHPDTVRPRSLASRSSASAAADSPGTRKTLSRPTRSQSRHTRATIGSKGIRACGRSSGIEQGSHDAENYPCPWFTDKAEEAARF
jgi:hypothetical protein